MSDTGRQSAGKDYAYLLGVYICDGSVSVSDTGHHAFTLNGVVDSDFAEATAAALRNLGYNPSVNSFPARRKSQKDYQVVYCGCHELAKQMKDDTDTKQKIPEYVFDWDRELIGQVVIGMFDSEAYVAKTKAPTKQGYAVTNRYMQMGFKSTMPWHGDFLRLLAMVGVRHGKLCWEKPRKEGYRKPWYIRIKMQSFVDSGLRFNIARKQNRVDEWASVPAYATRKRNPRRSTSQTNTLSTQVAPA